MDKCRKCGEPIRWTMTMKGKNLPIDPDPHPGGNVQLQEQGPWQPPLAMVHTITAPGVVYYISHFATCRGHRVTNSVSRAESPA